MRVSKLVALAAGAFALSMGSGLATGGTITFTGVEGDFSGSGIGSVYTLITLQAQQQSHSEAGSVAGGGPLTKNDIVTGDAKTGSNQSQTWLGSDLAATGITGSTLELVLQVNQDAGGDNHIAVMQPFTVNVYGLGGGSPVDSATFTPPSPPDPELLLPGTGTGHAGWVFQVTGLGNYLTAAYRFGIDVQQLGDPNLAHVNGGDANDGPETFFLANGSAVVPLPVTSSVWSGVVLMGALLGWRGWRRLGVG